jgi:hypothetical protein
MRKNLLTCLNFFALLELIASWVYEPPGNMQFPLLVISFVGKVLVAVEFPFYIVLLQLFFSFT